MTKTKQSLGQKIKEFVNKHDLMIKVMMLGLLSRLIVMGAGLYAYNFFPDQIQNGNGSVSYSLPESKGPVTLKNAFDSFDTWFYLNIAHNGYPVSTTLVKEYNFMPVLPLVMKIPSLFQDWNDNTAFYFGMAAANILFFASLVLIVRLLRGQKELLVLGAVGLLAFYPGSIYYSFAYSESFFLFFSLAAVYLLTKKKFLLASLCIGVAAITRKTGILLTFPWLWTYFNTRKSRPDLSAWSYIFLNLIWQALPLFIFIICLHSSSGSWTAITSAQTLWNTYPNFPFSAIFQALTHLKGNTLIQLLLWLGALGVLGKMRNILNRGWIIYSLLTLFVIVSGGEMSGIIRYLSVLFPLFFGAAYLLVNKKFLLELIMLTFAAGSVLMTILFVNGYGFAS